MALSYLIIILRWTKWTFTKVQFVICSIVFFILMCLAIGCGTTEPRRMPASYDYDDNSKAHPAAYLVDRFNVGRPMPEHEDNNVEFYFKKCTMAGDNWPISSTSYECDYP